MECNYYFLNRCTRWTIIYEPRASLDHATLHGNSRHVIFSLPSCQLCLILSITNVSSFHFFLPKTQTPTQTYTCMQKKRLIHHSACCTSKTLRLSPTNYDRSIHKAVVMRWLINQLREGEAGREGGSYPNTNNSCMPHPWWMCIYTLNWWSPSPPPGWFLS